MESAVSSAVESVREARLRGVEAEECVGWGERERAPVRAREADDRKGETRELAALRTLDKALRAASANAGQDLLMLQLDLLALVDDVVRAAPHHTSGAVRLAAAAYIDFVFDESGKPHHLARLEPAAALSALRARSERYVRFAVASTEHIVSLGCAQLCDLIDRGGAAEQRCVLVVGSSASLIALLQAAALRCHFTLLVAEGRADGFGHATAAALELSVPVRIIEPTAMARCMSRVRLVLCAAHTVLHDGGIVGELGTLTAAIVARAHRKPLCVTAPHYCFDRDERSHLDAATSLAALGGRLDATPPHLVTWFFTDLGVLTPAAVADWQLCVSERGFGHG